MKLTEKNIKLFSVKDGRECGSCKLRSFNGRINLYSDKKFKIFCVISDGRISVSQNDELISADGDGLLKDGTEFVLFGVDENPEYYCRVGKKGNPYRAAKESESYIKGLSAKKNESVKKQSEPQEATEQVFPSYKKELEKRAVTDETGRLPFYKNGIKERGVEDSVQNEPRKTNFELSGKRESDESKDELITNGAFEEDLPNLLQIRLKEDFCEEKSRKEPTERDFTQVGKEPRLFENPWNNGGKEKENGELKNNVYSHSESRERNLKFTNLIKKVELERAYLMNSKDREYRNAVNEFFKAEPVIKEENIFSNKSGGNKMEENEKNSDNETSVAESIEANAEIFLKAKKSGLIGADKTFYEAVKPQIEELFVCYPQEETLEKSIPDSKWVKIEFKDNEYYVVGVVGKNPDYICYGIPAVGSVEPPADIAAFCSWFPLNEKEPKKDGYWIMYQDAKTGKTLTL